MIAAESREHSCLDCQCLRFTEIPHTARLFADFLYRFERVQPFYARPPLTFDWLAEHAGRISMDRDRRQAVAAVLERQNRAWGASAETLANIDRLRAGAAAVVTGQQVGLFGGPAYSIHKALSALKAAAEFTRRGVPSVPIFWLATEDHDFPEVASAMLPEQGSRLARVSISSTSDKTDAPVGPLPLGPEIAAAVQQARALLGDSEVTDLLAACYTPAETMGSAFARLFSRAFARLGLVVIDPADPELHRLAAPIYRATIERAPELNRAVAARGKALDSAGYHQQVKVTAASTFLFRLAGGERVPIRRVNGGFSAGPEQFTPEQLAARAQDAPHEFSASALLRPIVQDFLLPTVAGVGGPAEVAYYAQSGPLFEALLGRVTPILPRFSVTLVEPHEARLLDRYRLELADLVHAERPAELLARRALPPDLEQRFALAQDSLSRSLGEVTRVLDPLDHTLVDAAARAGAKMRYQLERLHARAARAHLRRSGEVSRHAGQLTTMLFPERALQERLLAGVYFLARYGTGLLQTLLGAVQLDCPDHKIIRL